MKKHLSLLVCLVCLAGSYGVSAEAPAAPPIAAPAAVSPEIEQLRALIPVLRTQRDANAQSLQDTQVQLQLAQQRIAALTAEITATKAKLTAAAAEKPKTEAAATTTKPEPEKPAQ
jgi:septal ring factor EnvC (AmiA/AmiB activator)